jgi:uncharacterized membrane protein YfcA
LDFSSVIPLWQIVLLTVVSFLVGILGGFIGLALGTMRLPALLLLGVTPASAAGTNILVSTLSAAVGSIRHIREQRVDWRIVGLMGIPAVVGSFIGGFASSSTVPEGALIAIAGGFVTWQAVEFWMRLRRAAGPQQSDGALMTPGRGTAEAGIGLVVGLLGGAVGLILGSIRLPLIIRVLRADPRIAAGSNMVIGFLMGSFGFIGHGIKGEVDVVILVGMGLSGMAGTYIGALFTGRASLNLLIRTMAVVLLVVGVLLMRDGISRLLA